MDGKTLKETLKSGGRAYGFMISAMASARFGGALKGSTADYVVIDAEHGSRGRSEIETLCAMLRQADIAPVVRVPVPKAEWVAMALDAGASGVLVPYCETVEEVRAVVATANWHPLKGAYLRRAMDEGIFPSEDAKAYLEARHKHSFVIIGIESEPAFENLDAILDVGHIDGIFVGPNDLSTSLGIPDDYANPKYQSVVKGIIEKSEDRGVPVMVHQQTIETSAKAIALGARFILHAMDSNLLQRAIQSELDALRLAAGDGSEPGKDTVDIA